MPEGAVNFFKTDLRSIQFTLYEHIKVQQLFDAERFPKSNFFGHFSQEECDRVIEQTYRFCNEVLGPLNQIGDQVGVGTSTPVLLASGTMLLPPPPGNVTASDGTAIAGAVRIAWNPSAGAGIYRIWRNTANDANGAIEVGEVRQRTLHYDRTAVPGTTYYYWVTSRNAGGVGLARKTGSPRIGRLAWFVAHAGKDAVERRGPRKNRATRLHG